MKRMSGVVVPLVTPLTCDDKIDTVSLRKLTEYLISHGVDCLYPCGTTGEMMYLSVEERKLVASTVIKQAAGRIPVFVHVGAWNQKDTIDLAQHACQAGADGIGVVTPVYFPISEEGLIRYFKTVACSVPESFPVYLYGIKQNAVNDINVNICNEVAGSCRNVLGAKYSFPDMTMIQNLVLVNEGRFDVLVGPDHLYAAASAAGCCGVVSGNANVIPDHYTSIREALKENNSREALRLQQETNRIIDLLCAVNGIAAFKAVLKHMGIIASSKTRPPMEELKPEQEEELIRSFAQVSV